MKVRVSAELCTGHGRCYALAPEVYAPDEEGYNSARGETIEVADDQAEQAARGARGCPEGAIDVVGGGPAAAGAGR
jgi:ferredoxin